MRPVNLTTRRSWLQAAPAALAPFAAGSAQTGARPERPNIVLVISDQFRWDSIGAMGLNPVGLTPHLDAMAGIVDQRHVVGL